MSETTTSQEPAHLARPITDPIQDAAISQRFERLDFKSTFDWLNDLKEIKDPTTVYVDAKDIDIAREKLKEHQNIKLQAFTRPGSRKNSLTIETPHFNDESQIILHLPSSFSFSANRPTLHNLYTEYWSTPKEKRPNIIVYTDGDSIRLNFRVDFQGFSFCSEREELAETLDLLAQLRNRDKEAFRPQLLSPRQQQSYDESIDLREWEEKTADTYTSLKLLLQRMKKEDEAYDKSKKGELLTDEEARILPSRKNRAILDIGTGEGRIGGTLARFGYNVVGFDISSIMLKRAIERIEEEGKKIRGEIDTTGLAHDVIQRLTQEGVIPEEKLIIDDAEVQSHFMPVSGNFFNLHADLNSFMNDWVRKYRNGRGVPNPYHFFNLFEGNEYVFGNERDMFSDAGFDKALFSWHTFAEVGTPDNQQLVLQQLMNILTPGGEVIIEMPDTDSPLYSTEIQGFHSSHPDLPFGTVQDVKDDGSLYPPRYFPSRAELILMLKASGFDVDPEKDVTTYSVTDKNSPTKSFNELFIVARKPRF